VVGANGWRSVQRRLLDTPSCFALNRALSAECELFPSGHSPANCLDSGPGFLTDCNHSHQRLDYGGIELSACVCCSSARATS
jgi:hypothetical protein